MSKTITIRAAADFERKWSELIGPGLVHNAMHDDLKRFAGETHSAKLIQTQICNAIAKASGGHRIMDGYLISEQVVAVMVPDKDDQDEVMKFIRSQAEKLGLPPW